MGCLASLRLTPSPPRFATVAVIHADGKLEADPDRRLIKEEIITKYGLNPRDLRSLDAHILDVRPSLLVCGKALVVCGTCPLSPEGGHSGVSSWKQINSLF